MTYTKAEKEVLIRHLQNQANYKIQALKDESDKIADTCESKVLRRLNSVSVTLWNIKLKDVLDVERRHKPSVKNLLRDIESLRDNSGTSTNVSMNQFSSEQRPGAKVHGKITKKK